MPMPRLPHRPAIEELEPRLLYSADLAPVAFDAAQPLAAEVRVVDTHGEYTAAETVRRELILVDTRVDNYADLLDDLLGSADAQRRFDVVVLDPARDGLEQITEALTARNELDAVHILAHGEAGRLLLGSDWIDTDTLNTHGNVLAAWQDALTANADVLFYGCDVGAGPDGTTFVETFARLTGTDVAASDDRTGHASQNGDWLLETRVGTLDAPTLQALGWQGTLDLDAAATQTLVNTTTAGNQAASAGRAVAINPLDGSAVAVWMSDGQDGDAGGIYLQRYDANGDRLGGEVRVNTTTTGDQTAPAIAMNDSGAFVITWQSTSADGDGWGIVAQRFDASGTAVGGEILVNDVSPGDQTAPDVGMDAAGNFVVVWVDDVQDGDEDGVYARRFLADGSAAGGSFQVADTVANEQNQPAVAMNASGEFVIAWTSEDQDYSLLGGYSDGVYARRYDASGAALGSEFRAPFVTLADILITNDSQHQPDVAINSNGDFVIALTDDFDGTIKAHAYDSAGTHLGSVQANSATGETVGQAAVAYDGNGGFVVAWTELNADGSGEAVVARHFRSDLSAYAGEQVVNQHSPGTQAAPSLAIQQGRLLAVWSGQDAGDGQGVSLRSLALADDANDAPVITSGGGGASALINVAENSTAVGTVTASDADTPAQRLSYRITGGADSGLFGIDLLSGQLHFLAAPDYEAPADANADNLYEVEVQVFDGARTDLQSITVSVQPANEHAPLITSHTGAPVLLSLDENTQAVATFTASDADLPAPALSWSIAGGADALRFTIDALTGALEFVAPPDHDAPLDADTDNVYDVVVQVSDGSLTDTRTLAVTVQNVNEAPTAGGGGFGLLEDQTTTGTLPTASDPEGQPVDYTLVSDVAHGSLTLNTDGSFSYTPNADFNGIDQFVFRVVDGLGAYSEYSALFDVGPVNDAPVLSAQGDTVMQGHTLTLTPAHLQATDIDNATASLQYVLVAPPTGGALLLSGTALGVGGSFTQDDVDAGRVHYAHAGGAPGVDAFLIKLVDPGSEEAQASVQMTITPDPALAVAPPPAVTPPGLPPVDAGAPAAPDAGTPDAPPPAVDETVAAVPASPLTSMGNPFASLLESPPVVLIDTTPVLAPPAYGGGPATASATAAPPILAALEQTFQAVAHDLRALESMRLSFDSGDFQQQLDQLRDEIGQLNLNKNTVAASLALSTGLSVGYVLWLIRGGVLLSSLLSSLPAWRLIDPLPVLGHLGRRDDSDDESLEDMLEQPPPPPVPPEPADTRAP